MPPKKSENPKRAQEQHIQGWFVFADEPRNADLPVVQYFNRLRNKGWSPKQIIGEGILALRREQGEEPPEIQPPSNVDETIAQIFLAIARVQQTLEGAGVPIDAETRRAIATIAEAKEELSPIQESFADRLKSRKYVED